MLSARSEFADDVCPVRDELLGELHRANDLFIPGFVYGLAPDVRASLALFCYRRAHLHSLPIRFTHTPTSASVFSCPGRDCLKEPCGKMNAPTSPPRCRFLSRCRSFSGPSRTMLRALTYAELHSDDWTHPTCSGCMS